MNEEETAAILGRRLSPTAGPASTAAADEKRKWEDLHVRWTVWVDRDLRAQIEDLARTSETSMRELVDELLRAGLEQRRASRPIGRRRR